MTDQASSKETIVIHAVGNIAPRRVEYGEPVESLFALAQQKIKEADVSLCNAERLFTTKGCLQYRKHDLHNFADPRIDPENAKSLVSGGFNVVSHANNACFDYGPDALLDSIEVFRRNGMQVIGAGKDIAEARKPAILEPKGIKVGLLAYNLLLHVESEAREGKPGCAPIHVSTYYEADETQKFLPGIPPKIITIPQEDDVLAMEEDVRKLRGQVDVVVVSMHWGRPGPPGTIDMYQPTVGHRAVDAGADLIVGHHGTTTRGIEIYKGRAIFYCLANFAMERHRHLRPVEPGWERNPIPKDARYIMMAKCVASKEGIQKVSFLPCYSNQRAEPEFLSRTDARFQEVFHYIEPQCKELGTTLSVEGEEVIVFNSTKTP
ncbi:MAG: CapA family protein [Chloroflexi bacterium]|nr:CapA family protein [Chloroflexota bacterium]